MMPWGFPTGPSQGQFRSQILNTELLKNRGHGNTAPKMGAPWIRSVENGHSQELKYIELLVPAFVGSLQSQRCFADLHLPSCLARDLAIIKAYVICRLRQFVLGFLEEKMQCWVSSQVICNIHTIPYLR